MAQPKKVAIGVTSYNDEFYQDGQKTGAYYSEVYQPWDAFSKAGFEVDIVSETGKFGWDEKSIAKDVLGEEEYSALNDPESDFNQAVKNVKAAGDLDAKDYGVFYAAGGHGTVYDFNGKAPQLAEFFGGIYNDGGIASAVCHGPIILQYVKGKDGKPIIADKYVTGFPDIGEAQFGLVDTLKERGVPTVKEVVSESGKWEEPEPPLGKHSVHDTRIHTGANPASARALADEVIAAFNGILPN